MCCSCAFYDNSILLHLFELICALTLEARINGSNVEPSLAVFIIF